MFKKWGKPNPIIYFPEKYLLCLTIKYYNNENFNGSGNNSILYFRHSTRPGID